MNDPPDTPLITANALAQRLASKSETTTVLDVRWELGQPSQRAAYEAGHIQGAAFVDLDAELAGQPGPRGRHPLPDSEDFQASMRAAGVSDDSAVIVYDARNSMAAARAWWLLRYFGHQRVAVLDGCLAAWVEARGPLETGAPIASMGDFVARPGGMPLLDAAAAGRLANDGVLLDARTPERFRGEVEPIDPVAGHVPGARNRPSTENALESGRFRVPAELRGEFEALGVDTHAEVGAYCGSGVTAAHEVLALAIAGFNASLYVGSWSEWITDPARPVARGE